MESKYYRESPCVKDSLENLPWALERSLELPTSLAARAGVLVSRVPSQDPVPDPTLPSPALHQGVNQGGRPDGCPCGCPQFLGESGNRIWNSDLGNQKKPGQWWLGVVREDFLKEEGRLCLWRKSRIYGQRGVCYPWKPVGAWQVFRENSFFLHSFGGAFIICQVFYFCHFLKSSQWPYEGGSRGYC